jgi:hypothetical protein
MNREEWLLIQDYIDTKIDYAIAAREEDSDGYREDVYIERKAVEKAEEEILKYLNGGSTRHEYLRGLLRRDEK